MARLARVVAADVLHPWFVGEPGLQIPPLGEFRLEGVELLQADIPQREDRIVRAEPRPVAEAARDQVAGPRQVGHVLELAIGETDLVNRQKRVIGVQEINALSILRPAGKAPLLGHKIFPIVRREVVEDELV